MKKEKVENCIYCLSPRVAFNGTTKAKTQRYYCYDCRRSFVLNPISRGRPKKVRVTEDKFGILKATYRKKDND